MIKIVDKLNLLLTSISIIVTGFSMYYAYTAKQNTETIKQQITIQNETVNHLQSEIKFIHQINESISSSVKTEENVTDTKKLETNNTENSQTIQVGGNAGNIQQTKK